MKLLEGLFIYLLLSDLLVFGEYTTTNSSSLGFFSLESTINGSTSLMKSSTTAYTPDFSRIIKTSNTGTSILNSGRTTRKDGPRSTFQLSKTSAPETTQINLTETRIVTNAATLSSTVDDKVSDSTVPPKFQPSEKTKVHYYPKIFIELTMINQTDANFCEKEANELLEIFDHVARSKLLSRQSLETLFLNREKICGSWGESITDSGKILIDICIKTKGKCDALLTVIVWDTIENNRSILGKFKNTVSYIRIHGLVSSSADDNQEKEPHYVGWLAAVIVATSFVLGYTLTLLIRYLVKKFRRRNNKDAYSLDTATNFEYQIENNFTECYQQDGGMAQSVWM